ncbi:hypothetical protein L873DRAFT_1114370 [Choiromyces venosus 120613-1]|uniref:Secreted protein n=1 Tax=Choiromyces venosus 120613-1 TaxID=1336337 RepID=A0A3N4JH41_9PEZI|nr:hypothetical protein L873DRAFT_1114370 [Choiromyces venosus 120613-1]
MIFLLHFLLAVHKLSPARLVFLSFAQKKDFCGILQLHPVVPDDQNPKNLSGTANDPGRRIRFWCKEIQNSQRFVRDNEESGRVRSGTTGCDCMSWQFYLLYSLYEYLPAS